MRAVGLNFSIIRRAKNEFESFLVEIEFKLENGGLKRLRRSYPARWIAQIVKDDVVDRRDDVLYKFNSGHDLEITVNLSDAYAEWRASLSWDERLRWAEFSPTLASERDPEADRMIRKQSQERRAAQNRQRRREWRAKRPKVGRAEKSRQLSAALQTKRRTFERVVRTLEEKEAAQKRGQETKARFDAIQRERKLAAIERQDELKRCRQLAAARAEEFKRQKKAEAALYREARRLEVRRQRLERREAEKRERDRQQEQRKEEIRRAKLFPKSEDGVQPSIVTLEGAEVLLSYCAEGLLSQDEMFAIVELDACPDEITRSLKAVTLSSQDKPLSERKLVMSNLVASMRLAYDSIPVDEYVTRWSIRHWAQTVRREASLAMAGDNDQHEFMEYEPEECEEAGCLV